FVGATLTATSVGITARVLKDLDRIHLPEAQIILGAAVIDDVLGLIILAVVSGMVTMGAVSVASVALISLKAIVFLALALLIGAKFAAPWLGRLAQRMRVSGAVLVAALVFCFLLSVLADWIGLATIVGAFAAGLILEDHHFQMRRPQQAEMVEGLALIDSAPEETGHRMITIGALLAPLSAFLVPIFFVLMGIRVRLETFLDPSVIGLALTLTLAAFAGKLVCGLAVRRTYHRLVISLGMVPRGEVGLIFATIGRGLGVMDDALFSAMVIMVIMTTLVTPPLLTWSLRRSE
ncbi:MAG: cation:proton antiporter, partial [Candidatus Latescibacteria bacterium]|nr:cation:proton antiporter [Candidatus Latescibacterota bacterium]